MPASTRPRAAGAGFTLVELLIVVAVVAVLAGMGLAAARTVMAKSQVVRCEANLRTIGVAYLAYAADWKGWIPPNSRYGKGPSGANGLRADGPWRYYDTYFDFIAPYIEKGNGYVAKGLVCPTHRPRLEAAGYPGEEMPFRSYSGNYHLIHFGIGVRLDAIRSPAQTILSAERNGDLAGSHESVVAVYDHYPIDQETGQPVVTPGITVGPNYNDGDSVRISHRGRFGILCFDAHVEMVRPEDTVGTPMASTGGIPDRWAARY